jgi:esterase/lipase
MFAEKIDRRPTLPLAGCSLTVTEAIQKKVLPNKFPIESILSARLMLEPQLVDENIFFMSDISGTLSLYSMDAKGSIPQPLLPGGLALVNPHILPGINFKVYPKLGKILVMIDKLGDENYQPSFVPIDGGIPESIFGKKYENEQIICVDTDLERNIAYFVRDPRTSPNFESIQVNLETGETRSLGTSIYGNFAIGATSDHSTVILGDQYSPGDTVLYYWRNDMTNRQLLYGIPLEKREGKQVPASGIGFCSFVEDNRALLFDSKIFHDNGGLTLLRLQDPSKPSDVPIQGLQHKGVGEMVGLKNVKDNVFVLEYNIDGVSWIYEGAFNGGANPSFKINKTIVGHTPVSNGVVLGLEWEVRQHTPLRVDYVFAFTTSNGPSQLFVLHDGETPERISSERVLGIPDGYLSPGEDVSYGSFDGLRISARLYLPSPKLGFEGPRPLVEYVHGGPQGQERPDFTWFSMPLIQNLTLNGFAVFVPNVRGSTGYGQKYMKWVDKDWGGKDVQDHLEGLKRLEKDNRVDSKRRGVVGRSYGGYMTLTLAFRHPELWKAAVDMFGPYDLPLWLTRVPPTWQTYFKLVLGDPLKDKDFLMERSPKTYMKQLSAPLMIIQGRHDPRVPESESADLVKELRAGGRKIDYVVYEDEGHDVLRFKNRVDCYNKITEFFLNHLGN